MKKLLLMYPNMRWHKDDLVTNWNLNPTTLLLLAKMVKDIVDVVVIDAQFEDMPIELFQEKIAAIRPDYVGISLLTSEYKYALERTAKVVKETLPSAVVIAGGVHVTTMYEDVVEDKNIDYCVLGEGEYVLRQLLLALDNQGDMPSIGLAYKDKTNRLIVQPKAVVEDLSKLPWPDYDLIDYEPYTKITQREFNPLRAPELPFVRMVTTRGCPFGCSFCQVEIISGAKVRARDPEDVVNELEYLKKRYGIKSVIFDEDNILMAKGYAKRLFELMIERKLELKWIATAFALFLITDELLDLMKRSGCVCLNVAIESGNKRVLKEIVKKPIKDLDAVPGIIQKIKSYGINVFANFIIGFPGETWDEIRQTVKFAEDSGADYVKIYACVPLYKTPIYHLAIQMGALECDDKFPKVDWRYAQIKSDEWTPKDISILRAYEWDRINFMPSRIEKLANICGMSVEELNHIRKRTRDSLTF